MGSTLKLVGTYPILGYSAITQGMLGLAFSAFWTVLAFHLSGNTFHLAPSQIGYFGLAGAAGALAAPIAGKLSDQRGPNFTIPIGIGATFVAFFGMSLAPESLIGIILGAIVFDFGVQMSMVSHQSVIYAIDPGARGSITGVFMGSIFAFFAMGSLLGNATFQAFGWRGLTVLALASCLGAYFVHRLAVRQPHPRLA